MPTSPRRFHLAELPATPWKNGGGATRELAVGPPGAGLADFDWRVSVATIAASGPFSAFAGIDRSITLLAGDGVTLAAPGWRHALHVPLEPFSFAGEVPVEATLLGAPSEDFNVMTRRGRARAALHVWRQASALVTTPADAALLLAARGAWHWQPAPHATHAGETLAEGSGLAWPAGAAEAGHFTPAAGSGDSALLCVVISPLKTASALA